MYLEQVKKFTANPILYFVFPLGFIALMVMNYVASEGVDTNELIQQIIETFGVNLAFVMLIGPLSIGLLCLWFWVKFIQGQTDKINYRETV